MFQCFDIREDLFETGCVPWEKAVKDDVPNPENESKTRTSEPPKGRPAKRAKKASGEPRLTRKTVEAYRWINNCKHHDHRGIVHFWLWKALVSIEGGRKYGSIRFWGTCLFVFSSFITHTCDVFLWIHGPMETWKSGRRVIWERVSYTELTKEGRKYETRELRVRPIVQKTRGYDRRGDFYSIHIEVQRRPEDRFLPKYQEFDLEDRNFLHISLCFERDFGWMSSDLEKYQEMVVSWEKLRGDPEWNGRVHRTWVFMNCESGTFFLAGFKDHSFDFLMNNGSYKGRPVGHIAIYPGGYWVVGLKKSLFDRVIWQYHWIFSIKWY